MVYYAYTVMTCSCATNLTIFNPIAEIIIIFPGEYHYDDCSGGYGHNRCRFPA